MVIEEPKRKKSLESLFSNIEKNEVLEKIWKALPALPFEYGIFTLPIPRGIAEKIYKKER